MVVLIGFPHEHPDFVPGRVESFLLLQARVKKEGAAVVILLHQFHQELFSCLIFLSQYFVATLQLPQLSDLLPQQLYFLLEEGLVFYQNFKISLVYMQCFLQVTSNKSFAKSVLGSWWGFNLAQSFDGLFLRRFWAIWRVGKIRLFECFIVKFKRLFFKESLIVKKGAFLMITGILPAEYIEEVICITQSPF